MTKQDILPFPLSGSLCAADLLISNCNRTAIETIKKWPDWPTRLLILYGEEGSGKTHIGKIWQEKTQCLETLQPLPSTPYILAEEKHSEFNDEALLFPLLNHALTTGHFVLLTSSRPPSQWQVKENDTLSRLQLARTIAIHPPEPSLLKQLLVKHCSDRQLVLSPSVLSYLSSRLPRSFKTIKQVVQELDTLSLSYHRTISMDLARKTLDKLGLLSS